MSDWTSMTCPYCQILQPCGCPNDWSGDDEDEDADEIDLSAPVQLTEGAKAWLEEPGVMDYLNAEWAKLGLKPLK